MPSDNTHSFNYDLGIDVTYTTELAEEMLRDRYRFFDEMTAVNPFAPPESKAVKEEKQLICECAGEMLACPDCIYNFPREASAYYDLSSLMKAFKCRMHNGSDSSFMVRLVPLEEHKGKESGV